MTTLFSQQKLSNKEQKNEWRQALESANSNERSAFNVHLKGKTAPMFLGKKSSHVGQLSGPKWRRDAEIRDALGEHENAKVPRGRFSM
jgi:hypothetical protein